MTPPTAPNPNKRQAPDNESPAKKARVEADKESFANMTEMVDLYVGSEETHFHVHKDLLCKKIPYFNKMFKGSFKECSDGVGTFPEDNPESFDILLKWVYSGTLQTLDHTEDPQNQNNWVASFNLMDLYVLVDKFCLPKLMDALVNNFIDNAVKHNFLPVAEMMDWAYAKTREGDGIRKFVLYSFTYILNGLSRSEDYLQTWPTSSLEQLMFKHRSLLREYLELVRQSPIGEVPKDPTEMLRCVFHHHGENEECSLKG